MVYKGAVNISNKIWSVLILGRGQHGVHGDSQH